MVHLFYSLPCFGRKMNEWYILKKSALDEIPHFFNSHLKNDFIYKIHFGNNHQTVLDI